MYNSAEVRGTVERLHNKNRASQSSLVRQGHKHSRLVRVLFLCNLATNKCHSLCFGFPSIALMFVLFWDELPLMLPDAIVITIKREDDSLEKGGFSSFFFVM